MSEKSPRRMPILITAEGLDYKESVARTENKRVRNRLELNKGTLSEHENTNLSSMNYEMRRLKHELKGIKQTSGYFIVNHETSEGLQRGKLGPRSRRRHKKPRVGKRRHREVTQDAGSKSGTVDGKSVQIHRNLRKSNAPPVLPNIPPNTSTETQASGPEERTSELSNTLKIIPDSSNVNITLDTTTKYNNHRSLTASCDINSNAPVEALVPREKEEIGLKSQELERPHSKELTKSDTALGLDMDAARDRVQTRLTVNPENSNQALVNDSNLSPYKHVPPDGLPRTVYLLPPLKDLLNEAKKARYIRKLRKPHTVLDEDDPERELNIDEIFRKS